MNFTKNSPFFTVEDMLGKFLDEEIQSSKLFEILERQHTRITGWLENLCALTEENDQTLDVLSAIGIEGSEKMLEGLEDLFTAVEEGCPDSMDEACATIWAGHEVISLSFKVCDDIEEEEVREVIKGLSYA